MGCRTRYRFELRKERIITFKKIIICLKRSCVACTFIGETGSELPAGASGGIYPQVKPDLVAGCHISAGGGGNKSDPGGTALPHVIKHTLDDKMAAAAENDTGNN